MFRRIVSAVLLAAVAAVSFAAAPAVAGKSPQKPQRVVVSVTNKGFEPATIPVKAGQPIVLVITRKTDRTCATEIVIKDRKINVPLPLNKTVEVKLAAEKPGTLRFACGMDMITGQIVVK
ncbi:MAG: cupredoxin domain-containing protein [Candidatus Eisenbacteria bacterium]